MSEWMDIASAPVKIGARSVQLAKVCWAALTGKSFCWLNAVDRAREACDLPDDSFIKWGRWATAIVSRVWENDADRKGRDFDEVLVLHSAVALARLAIHSGNTRMISTVEGVTFRGVALGDWRVTIEQIAPAQRSE